MRIQQLFDVRGRTALVTGGASGIGLGYAEALAANGARVALLDMDARRIDAEVSRLRGAGMDVSGHVVDVTDHAALDRAVDEIVAGFGHLDAAFANAGIDPGPGYVGAWVGDQRPRVDEGALERYADARWNRVIDVNLNGVFATVRAAARHMRSRRKGRIILTTSAASQRIEPAIGAAYMAAKAGAAHFMRCVALELAASGITVNAIAPGMFVTNIGGGHAKDPAVQKALAAGIPLHRVGMPSDMYGLALLLASDAGDYITGQEIVIDGGLLLGRVD
ncbi:MAG: SDR family oxidoreductase [Proteobacteria bacterium]|nr:SDR family oxidoreductase [Pseudomonadota bacterium]